MCFAGRLSKAPNGVSSKRIDLPTLQSHTRMALTTASAYSNAPSVGRCLGSARCASRTLAALVRRCNPDAVSLAVVQVRGPFSATALPNLRDGSDQPRPAHRRALSFTVLLRRAVVPEAPGQNQFFAVSFRRLQIASAAGRGRLRIHTNTKKRRRTQKRRRNVAHDLRRSRVEVHSVPRVVKKRPHTSKKHL